MRTEKRKMERNGETTSFGGGAGGKLRKPTRKPPTTPYSRPAASEADRAQRRGLLSKLVDPACRLITGGASLFFPAFFSKSPLTTINATSEHHGEASIRLQPSDFVKFSFIH